MTIIRTDEAIRQDWQRIKNALWQVSPKVDRENDDTTLLCLAAHDAMCNLEAGRITGDQLLAILRGLMEAARGSRWMIGGSQFICEAEGVATEWWQHRSHEVAAATLWQ